jgi:hypothetical protein
MHANILITHLMDFKEYDLKNKMQLMKQTTTSKLSLLLQMDHDPQ